MKLMSCDNCAVVLDGDKLRFPADIHNAHGDVDLAKAEWSGDAWVPFCNCPVCAEPILKEDV